MLIVNVCFIKQRLSVIKKLTGVVLLCLLNLQGFSQKYKTISLDFKTLFGDQALVLDSTYTIENNQTVQIENLKFYISNITLYENHKRVWSEKSSYHLYDQAILETHSVKLNVPANTTFDQIKFDVGIDSVTNVSGALGGDLDPTKGMYWTWQSGYINFKLEGTSSLSTHPKKEFQLHLGGYQKPYDALQRVYVKVDNKEQTFILFDVKQFLQQHPLSAQHHIMSPCKEAVSLSQGLIECFKVK